MHADSQIAEIGDLDTIDLTKNVANYQRGLQRVLSVGAILVGGVDVSLNTFDNLDPHWCVHFYFVVGDPGGVVDWAAFRAYAKRHAPKVDSSRVFRGVRISKPVPPEDRAKVLSYSFKSLFSWRSGYWGRSEKTNGPRRNSRKLPLPSGYRVELALFLDKFRIFDRLLLIGVRRNGDDADFTLGSSGTSVVTAAAPVRRRSRRGPR